MPIKNKPLNLLNTIRHFAIIVFCSINSCVVSQNWGAIPGADFDLGTEAVMHDSVHDELIVSSRFFNKVNGITVRGICRWNGTRWDSLAGGINTHDKMLNPNNPDGRALACVEYQGKLLVGGYFQSMGGVNATSLALWDGIKWDSLPKRAFRFNDNLANVVTGFYYHNNLLYIHGLFDTIAGQPCSGIATWDGTNFNPITLPLSYISSISSVAYYKNYLYVAGGFFDPGVFHNHKRHILRYNGSVWDTVGVGILGSNGVGLSSMSIYNNELYVGGSFFKSDGNAGEHIMKWDGSQWYDIGFSGDFIGNVAKLTTHDNKLYAIGGFQTAANKPANYFAVYDGSKWCTTQDTVDNVITSIANFRDTLYISGGMWKAGQDSVHGIAKLMNEQPYRWCEYVGIKELKIENSIAISPNPTNSIINIRSEQNLHGATIVITNMLGQSVLKIPFKELIDVSALPAGMYYLSIEDKEKRRTMKVVKE